MKKKELTDLCCNKFICIQNVYSCSHLKNRRKLDQQFCEILGFGFEAKEQKVVEKSAVGSWHPGGLCSSLPWSFSFCNQVALQGLVDLHSIDFCLAASVQCVGTAPVAVSIDGRHRSASQSHRTSCRPWCAHTAENIVFFVIAKNLPGRPKTKNGVALTVHPEQWWSMRVAKSDTCQAFLDGCHLVWVAECGRENWGLKKAEWDVGSLRSHISPSSLRSCFSELCRVLVSSCFLHFCNVLVSIRTILTTSDQSIMATMVLRNNLFGALFAPPSSYHYLQNKNKWTWQFTWVHALLEHILESRGNSALQRWSVRRPTSISAILYSTWLLQPSLQSTQHRWPPWQHHTCVLK